MRKDFRGPSAKRFDWQHIFDRHSEGGTVAGQSAAKTIFTGLSQAQIKTCVKAAWRNRERVRSQIDPFGIERILYRGVAGRGLYAVELWYNVSTRTVETAYPVKGQQ